MNYFAPLTPRLYLPGGMALLLLVCLMFAPGASLSGQRADTTYLDAPTTYTIRLHREDAGDSPVVDEAGSVVVSRKRFDRILTIERRRMEPGYWQFGASLGIGVPYQYDYRNGTYRRVSNPREGRAFVLPTGETIFGSDICCGGNGDQTNGVNLFPRVSFARQSRWGGYAHATLGYYRGRIRPKGDPFAGLSANEFQVVTDLTEDIVTFELGFQYTFARNRRFRPFIGLSLNNFLYYYGEEVTRFYDARTGLTGVDSGFSSKEFFPLYTELAYTAGFQFEVNDKVSLGAHVHVNNAWNIWLNSPVGMEVRYSLK